jgi:hypothetical protein
MPRAPPEWRCAPSSLGAREASAFGMKNTLWRLAQTDGHVERPAVHVVQGVDGFDFAGECHGTDKVKAEANAPGLQLAGPRARGCRCSPRRPPTPSATCRRFSHAPATTAVDGHFALFAEALRKAVFRRRGSNSSTNRLKADAAREERQPCRVPLQDARKFRGPSPGRNNA